MKAEITKTGSLQIVPETEIEQFALSLWAKDYFKQGETGETGFASLIICRIEELEAEDVD